MHQKRSDQVLVGFRDPCPQRGACPRRLASSPRLASSWAFLLELGKEGEEEEEEDGSRCASSFATALASGAASASARRRQRERMSPTAGPPRDASDLGRGPAVVGDGEHVGDAGGEAVNPAF